MKQRLQFDDIYEALFETEGLGGWFFVREDGAVFWFEPAYTLSEVMMVTGKGKVGTRSFVASELLPEPLNR